MSFARPAEILNRLFPKGNPRDRWPAWTDEPVDLGPDAAPVAPVEVPQLPTALPLWRSFVVTTRDAELARLDGYGEWLLNEVLRAEIREHKADPYRKEARADRVVWCGARVAALVRPLGDGALQVVRFPGSGPIGAASAAAEGGDR